MKKELYLILMLGLFSCGDPQFTVQCLPANLQNGVIAFYPFNDGSLQDDSSYNNDLTNPSTAIPTADRNGNFNCAYKFNHIQASEEFLTMSNPDFLNGLDEFSISMWYKPMDTSRIGGTFEILLSRGDKSQCPDRRGEWSVGLFDCRRAVFGHNNSVRANLITDLNQGCQGEVAALTDHWHHVVAIKNKDKYKIYFNGKLDETATGNANCGSTLHLAADMGDMFIGKHYTGKIDDIIIYDRELSQSEVIKLFILESCCQ